MFPRGLNLTDFFEERFLLGIHLREPRRSQGLVNLLVRELRRTDLCLRVVVRARDFVFFAVLARRDVGMTSFFPCCLVFACTIEKNMDAQ